MIRIKQMAPWLRGLGLSAVAASLVGAGVLLGSIRSGHSVASGDASAPFQDASIGVLSPDASALPGLVPPLPDGVAELKFAEFYRTPVGPRGLEYTDRLVSLRGKEVRVLGYMVRQDQPVPRAFLLSPVAMTLHENEYGFCDDLPPQILHVLISDAEPPKVPFTPGLLLLTGRLDLGPRQEPDGRVSHMRLFLNPPVPRAGSRG